MNEINIPWDNQKNTFWNETCIRVVDHFGLPGGKYTTEVSEDYMKFFFKDKRDALLCKILISEYL